MMDEVQHRESAARAKKRTPRKRLRILVLVIVAAVFVLLVPPWVSIGRYRGRIAQAVSESVGRPVQISSVELRLVPWPGFLINNLSIAEDPAYGAEPVLHANTVRVSIRLLSLWRGRLEISAIHVDEASLNIVRAGQGRWNLDPLLRTATKRTGDTRDSRAGFEWPSLDATNSRINIKNGAEKLPFSLLNTDLSFWQENNGEWRVRMRGQPARTDMVLELGDTGTLRIEASMKAAAALSQMPVQVDVDWREAQLGQLSKLLVGSDPGWRGDLEGNLHMEGTAAAAKVAMRLRATGVHRAEFAPRSSMDFDANCALTYHYAQQTVEGLDCNSPLGDGRVRVTGGMATNEEPSHLTVELDRVPMGAGLDLLRTMRSGLAPDLEAAGTVSGRVEYMQQATDAAPLKDRRENAVKRRAVPVRGPLSGAITIDGFALSGGALTQPLEVAKITLQAVEPDDGLSAPYPAIEGTFNVNAGAPGPLTVDARLTSAGYEASFRGAATIARARQMALAAGWSQVAALNDLAGDPLAVNLTASGPWLAKEPFVPVGPAAAAQAHAVAAASSALGASQGWPSSDHVRGTIAVKNANWKSDYLANHVEIAQATLHLEESALRWDPVEFSYGPIKGTATINIPQNCVPEAEPSNCAPDFAVNFGQLDASTMEAALLGAREKGTMLSDLIDRLHPAAAPNWPVLNGSVTADSVLLGPVRLDKASATVKFAADHADVLNLKGTLLGGQLQGDGTVSWAENDQKQPTYSISAHCDKLNVTEVGELLGQRWSGGGLSVDGKVDLAGFSDEDLAKSAKGALHFVWSRGTMPVGAASRFDSWSGAAQIGDNGVTLGDNEVNTNGRKQALEGSVAFGAPAKMKLAVAKAK